MGVKTEIAWCDSTVNPTTGCQGCELHIPGRGGTCYAGVLHETRLAKSLPLLYAPSFTDVRLAPGRMAKAASWPDMRGQTRPDKPWLDGMPRHIFVGDMGDVFSADVPFDYLKRELIDVANSPAGRRHVWMVLTKQARRLIEFVDWLGEPLPENVWPGTSVTSQANVSRAGWLPRNSFLSVEPLLSAVDISEALESGAITLCIVGGESGPHARPMHPDWVRSIRDQCQAAGTRFFFKQWGEWAPYDNRVHGIVLPGSEPSEVNGRPLAYLEDGPTESMRLMPGGIARHFRPKTIIIRIGKKSAGRLLDGREWSEMPGHSIPIINTDPTLSAPVRGEREDLPGQQTLRFEEDDA